MTALWTSDLDELTGRRGRALTASLLGGPGAAARPGADGSGGIETGTGWWPARVRDLLRQVGDAAARPGGEGPARRRL